VDAGIDYDCGVNDEGSSDDGLIEAEPKGEQQEVGLEGEEILFCPAASGGGGGRRRNGGGGGVRSDSEEDNEDINEDEAATRAKMEGLLTPDEHMDINDRMSLKTPSSTGDSGVASLPNSVEEATEKVDKLVKPSSSRAANLKRRLISRCSLPKLRADDFSCLGRPQRFFPTTAITAPQAVEDEDDEEDFYMNLNPLESDRSRSWDRVLERALMSTPIDSRAFRAGVILNPLRGLTAAEREESAAAATMASMASPTRPTDGAAADFKGMLLIIQRFHIKST